MPDARHKTTALMASAALVATLGLVGCGASEASDADEAATATTETEVAQTAEPTSEAPEAAPTTDSADSSIAKYGLQTVWVGQGEDDVTYYFEGAQRKAGAFLVYHMGQGTYERWLGAMTASADDQVTITDDESGETISLTIGQNDDGTVSITTDRGSEARLSELSLEDVGDVLDTIGTYATKPGEPSQAPTTEEQGGEFLIKIGTEGMGQIALVTSDVTPDYADSTFTHADAGDTITLTSRADEGAVFVKWTRGGTDYSTDAEVQISVDGDAEYIAVFEPDNKDGD